jgi:hypothetical protein
MLVLALQFSRSAARTGHKDQADRDRGIVRNCAMRSDEGTCPR